MILITLVFALITCFNLQAFEVFSVENFASQSFMFTRPATHNLAMQQAQWHNHIYQKSGSVLGSLQIVPFYQKTPGCDCDEGDEAAGYFLPNCKRSLIVAGDNVVLTTARDVRSEWFDIPNHGFNGKLSLSPQQKQYGVLLEYHQDIKRFSDESLLEMFWASVTMPFVGVKNELHVQQRDVINPGTAAGLPKDIVEAVKQSRWRYGKLDNQALKQSGLTELKFRLGAALYAKKGFEVDVYNLLSAPMSGKQCPDFLFSPFIGNNGHWSIGAGVNFQFPLTRKDADYPLFFFFNAEHQFLIRNKQFRTFDLQGKPWSRFLLLNSSDGTQVNVPGVNVLTRRVTVKPDSFGDISTGLRVRSNSLEAELGYNLWAHGDERIHLRKTFCKECREEIPLGDFGIAGSVAGRSASGSTIANQAADDGAFVTLNELMLDLNSGAGRSAVTHRIHGSVGFGHNGESYDGFINVGVFYEHPQKNAALKMWGMWAKVGASF